MKVRCLLLLAAGLLIAADAPDDKAKQELAKFQGEWTVTLVEYDGNKTAEENLNNQVVKIKGDKASLNQLKLTFKIDPTTTPRLIDVTLDMGQAYEGIYAFEGDTLKVCLCVAAEKQRPTEFSAPDMNHILYVLQRAKQ